MNISDKISKDIKSLERKSFGASKSMYKKLLYDHSYLSELYYLYHNEEAKLLKKNYDYSNVVRLPDYIDIYAEELKNLSQYIIDYYKSINFYYYGLESYVDLSIKDEEEILYSFLEYFNKELIDIYEQLLKENRFFIHNEKDIIGITYSSLLLDSHYIGAAPDLGFINRIETLIHELNHIYAFKFADNYNYDALESLYLGLFGEVTTLYSELSLYDYFIKNNIMPTEMMKHRNCLDVIALQYYKTMRYVTEVLTSEKVSISTNGVDYEIIGDFNFNPDKDIPFYKYTDDYKKGSLISLVYSTSYIKAYELLEKEKNGIYTPKEAIDEFIISLQNEKEVLSFLEEPFSFPFMENELLERKKIMEKKYPIPGYSVK